LQVVARAKWREQPKTNVAYSKLNWRITLE